MTPIVLFRYKGFLIRVVNNGSTSYQYEWTLDGITPKTKQLIRKDALRRKTYHKTIASMRKLTKRYSDENRELYDRHRFRRLNTKLTRIIDPASMPTARVHSCSAQGYAYDAVDDILNPPKPYVLFNHYVWT